MSLNDSFFISPSLAATKHQQKANQLTHKEVLLMEVLFSVISQDVIYSNLSLYFLGPICYCLWEALAGVFFEETSCCGLIMFLLKYNQHPLNALNIFLIRSYPVSCAYTHFSWMSSQWTGWTDISAKHRNDFYIIIRRVLWRTTIYYFDDKGRKTTERNS